MIICAGERTDIPQHYSDWLLNRFAAGYVVVRNPIFPEKLYRFELDPSVVDCVVFCSKDYAPLLDRLHEVTDRFNTYFFYTITAYGADIEPGVPAIDAAVRTLAALSDQVGRQRVVWRFSPILLTETYTKAIVHDAFERIAQAVAPHVSRCIFNFVRIYKKLAWNMPEACEVSPRDKRELVEGFSSTARALGMRLQGCCGDDGYADLGVEPPGCIDLSELGAANGVRFRRLAHRGMSPGCRCFDNRDIGAYETCPNGCRYCYANADHARARLSWLMHDPSSEMLCDRVRPGEVVVPGVQRGLLERGTGAAEQLSLF